MIDNCRSYLSLFNAAWVCEEAGAISIDEKASDGAGSAIFSSKQACIVVRAESSSPLIWSLAQRKCADGALITFNKDGAHLHIVELKSKVTLKAWAHALQQFEGMYLTSLAISRLLKIFEVQSVTCYIAAKEYKLSDVVGASASPSLIKTEAVSYTHLTLPTIYSV